MQVRHSQHGRHMLSPQFLVLFYSGYRNSANRKLKNVIIVRYLTKRTSIKICMRKLSYTECHVKCYTTIYNAIVFLKKKKKKHKNILITTQKLNWE